MKQTWMFALSCFICIPACHSDSGSLASAERGADMYSGGVGGDGEVDDRRHRGCGDGGVVGGGDAGAADGGSDAGSAGSDAGGAQDGGGSAPPSPFIDTADRIHAFMTFDYRITADQIPAAAAHTDFVWGNDDLGKLDAWHKANPKIFVTHYIPFDEDPANHPLSWWQANHPDWVLYRCDRKTPARADGYPNIDLDVTNPEVQKWQLEMVKTAASQGYDGIAFDVFAIDNAHAACGVYRNGQWVQRYTGNWSDAQYTADVLDWLHAMYTAMHALPKPMGLVPNYTLARGVDDATTTKIIENVDAVLDEAWPGNWGAYTTGWSWQQRVQFMVKLQQAGKAYYSIAGFSPLTNADVQWSLASYLMGKEHYASLFVSEVQGAQYGADAWRPEYAAAIGHACGAMTAASGGAYVRSFAHGLAIANPSGSQTVKYALPSGATYKDLAGNVKSGTLTLAPHSGLVLLVDGAPRC